MANITVHIRLRRTEGRSPVDPDELARTLLDELESSILDQEVSVDDSDGEVAAYEITAVTAAASRRDAPALPDPGSCARCGAEIQSDPMGRPRLYCSPACRQAAHRVRRRESVPDTE
jgi:predicted Zn-ribbon and HTH transcriptional regulator